MRKFLAVVALVVLACGKRGDPRPPVPVIPAATSDLVVTQRADRVLLSWSYPALTTAGKNLTEIRRISVYRYDEHLPAAPGGSGTPTVPQAQFMKLSTRIDSIEKANLAAATAGARLLFTDTPPFRSSDGRPVRLTYAVVTEGESARSQPSNLAIIVPLPVAIPPAGLTAAAKPEGVALTWTAPQQAVSSLGAPVVTGYNIYRSAPGSAPGVLDVAINTAPVTATTYTDAPAYGEHEYRVAAVAAAGPPLLQSDLSAPAKVTFRDLVAPPAPASITPLIETRAVRLIWDAVEATDLGGYRVYRAEGVGHENAIREIATVPLFAQPVTATDYIDSGADPGIAYRYAVTAVDKNGNESPRVWTGWVVVPKTP